MKGFTGEIYDGYPVFIREEYEAENAGRSELDRLNDLDRYTGHVFSDIDSACATLSVKNSPLGYTIYPAEEARFTGGLSNEDMWVKHSGGIIHKVTREFRKNICDRSPSRPAWMKTAWHCPTVSESNDLFFRDAGNVLTGALKCLIALLSSGDENP